MAVNFDNALKFGCGRYIQEENAIINNLKKEINRFGKKVLFICGKNGIRVAGEQIKSSLKDSEIEYEISVFTSTPCYENADEYVTCIKEKNFDIVCGVGGGVIGDTAKLVAARANTRLIQIPTSSATCVAVTPLSVLYDRKTHAHICDLKLMGDADAVIVDLNILINQPHRLFWSGIMDSFAKSVEIFHRINILDSEKYPKGALLSLEMSKIISEFYTEKYDELNNALNSKKITKDFDKAVFYAIAVTGIIQAIAGGSSAMAHRFHEQVRTFYYDETKYFLHGEIVAMGLIIQRAYNGLDYAEIIELLEKMHIPTKLADINITDTEKAVDIFSNELYNSKIITDKSIESKEKIIESILKIC